MSRNGVGIYVLPTGQPVVTGTTISSATFNTLTTDLANALTTSIATDGQTAMSANLPMGGNKVTGLAAATVAGDAVRFEQFSPLLNALLSNNGYQKLPSGLIIQWVNGAAAIGGTAVTYPIAFPTASLLVIGSTNPNNTAIFLSTYSNSLSGTSVVAYPQSGVSVASNFNLLAIGY